MSVAGVLAARLAARVPTGAVAAATLALLVWLGVRPVGDPSPWLHLRVGEFLAGGGRFGLPDPFSPMAERAYLPTQWLPSVLGFELYAVLGLPAVAWLRCLAILGLFLALVGLARRGLPLVASVLLAAVGTAASLPAMTERPQAFGMVLLAVSVLGWWRALEDGRPRWWLVPVAWLFASSHGLWSVALGFGALVCVGRWLDGSSSARELLPLGRLLLAQLAVTALTPLGPALLLTPLLVGRASRDFVAEWQPGSVGSPTVVAVLVLLAAVVAVHLRNRDPLPWSRLLVLATALTLAFLTVRTGAPAVVVVMPLVAEAASRALSGRSAYSLLPVRWLVAAVAVAGALALPLALARASEPVGVPTGLAASLGALPEGTPLLVQDDLSGWVLWTAPGLAPVVDIRSEAYSGDRLRSYVRTYQGQPGWERLVDSSKARYALVEQDSAVAGALVDVRHWRVLGADSGFLLLGATA